MNKGKRRLCKIHTLTLISNSTFNTVSMDADLEWLCAGTNCTYISLIIYNVSIGNRVSILNTAEKNIDLIKLTSWSPS